MSQTAPITDANPSGTEMAARVARFHRRAAADDYVDAAIPGCERTTSRVLDHPRHAPLAAEHFPMYLVRGAPGKAAPLHNHLTQEVFVALTGEREVFWGPQGARALRLAPYDVVSIAPGVSRGLRNVGADEALPMGIAGGHDPGHINRPASVRAAAAAARVKLPAA